MRLSQKIYEKHDLLFFILFVNILIYSIISSLVLFQTLVLVKILIIRLIFLLLHKYKVFKSILSLIMIIYCWVEMHLALLFPGDEGYAVSQEKLDEIEAERVKYRDRDRNSKEVQESELSTTTVVILVVVVFGFGLGIPALNHFYPAAIPAITSAVIVAGTSILEVFKPTLFESNPANPAVQTGSVFDPDYCAETEIALGKLQGMANGVLAQYLAAFPETDPSVLTNLVQSCKENNISVEYFVTGGSLAEMCDMICVMPAGTAPLFIDCLKPIDILFYRFLERSILLL